MKTQILTALSLVLLGVVSTFGTAMAQNTTPPTDKPTVACMVYTGGNGLVTFRMEKDPSTAVMVNLYDKEGTLLSTRRYKKPSNIKLLYDLSGCPGGLYQIRVKAGNDVVFTSTVDNPENSLAGE